MKKLYIATFSSPHNYKAISLKSLENISQVFIDSNQGCPTQTMWNQHCISIREKPIYSKKTRTYLLEDFLLYNQRGLKNSKLLAFSSIYCHILFNKGLL